MKLFRTLLCALAFVGAGAQASTLEPKDGVDYMTLPVAQNTDAGKKIEVIEFFAYYCPHCYAFEPHLAAWVKQQGENIVFKRVHVANGPSVAPQQRLFDTLDALAIVPQYHDKVFAAIHVERQRLGSDEAVFAWADKAGIDHAQFVSAYRSFGVAAHLRRDDAMMSAYHIDQWPMVAVDGRFMTSPSIAHNGAPEANSETDQQMAALKVLDFFVAKAKAEKK